MARIIKTPFFTILFSILPIVFLTAQNMALTSWRDPLRSLVISFSVTLVLMAATSLILKSGHRAGLVCTLLLALFFLYGHIATLLEGVLKRDLSYAEMNNLAVGLTVVVLVVMFGIVRLRHPEHLTPPLNLIALFLLTINLVSIGYQSYKMNVPVRQEIRQLAEQRGDAAAGALSVAKPASPAPDVYWIILDAYERGDKLKTAYRFDNEPFLSALRERGFYVADASRSNYLETAYSVPSMLNMVYLNDLPTSLVTRMTSSHQVNFVHDFLKARGYTTINFISWYEISNDTPSDENLSPLTSEGARPNPFEILLVKTSILRILFTQYLWNQNVGGVVLNNALEQDLQQVRDETLYAFETVPQYAERDGDFFVFSHFMVPHYPYVWGPQGEIIPYDPQKSPVSGNELTRQNAWYYTGQLEYVNTLALNMVDAILERSETPPIIIVQGDHGHDAFLDWKAPTMEGLDIRSSVLNAIYLPDQDYSPLYPEISLVNTFRVVFNQQFGTNYPLLPDAVYASPTSQEPLFIYENGADADSSSANER